jgi:hypothetical protein
MQSAIHNYFRVCNNTLWVAIPGPSDRWPNAGRTGWAWRDPETVNPIFDMLQPTVTGWEIAVIVIGAILFLVIFIVVVGHVVHQRKRKKRAKVKPTETQAAVQKDGVTVIELHGTQPPSAPPQQVSSAIGATS